MLLAETPGSAEYRRPCGPADCGGFLSSDSSKKASLGGMALAAMGVVYGDIGTSPLYTMKEVFNGHHPLTLTPDNLLGILSMVFWAMTITVSLKYVVFITRADNRGEGGIMALTALALRTAQGSPRLSWGIAVLGIFGAALFYGDAVITPAMSVLSAVEGLEVATPMFTPYVVPITLGILFGMFLFQRRGTASVAALFGPVMLFWFATLGTLGLINLIDHPRVLAAINPWYAWNFFMHEPWAAFLSMGAVVLAITGGEALYADMGHFGRRPIKYAWLCFVFPMLYLNYLGQGGLLLDNPEAIKNPFFMLVPEWLLFPMVGLATCATVIASQAVISGAFSLTSQAMQLGYCPRIQVKFTSEREKGQIYIPNINWLLMIAVMLLVITYQTSSNLAAMYGIAVTLTMMIDTVLAFIVVRSLWKWRWWQAAIFLTGFAIVDFAFFAACSTKILDGGWFPLVLGLSVFAVLSTWRKGRGLLLDKLKQDAMPLNAFLESLDYGGPHRVEGTGIYMTPNPDGVPRAMLHNLLHNKVLHERIIMLNVQMEDVPHVPEIDRVEVHQLKHGFNQVIVRFGFKDDPDVPAALGMCSPYGVCYEPMETSFFLARETIIPSKKVSGMPAWREVVFKWMFRNADPATAFFKIPPNRVVELGSQVEM
jgi:KUP system potassium uptake protein